VYARRFEIVRTVSPQIMEAPNTRMASKLIKRPLLTLMWTSVGLAVVAGALYVGNELRKQRLGNRYPYESYSHAGEDQMMNGTEYGVGI
jgi:hypothetical protein